MGECGWSEHAREQCSQSSLPVPRSRELQGLRPNVSAIFKAHHAHANELSNGDTHIKAHQATHSKADAKPNFPPDVVGHTHRTIGPTHRRDSEDRRYSKQRRCGP